MLANRHHDLSKVQLGMLSMQKELLDTNEQASRVWLSRMKSDVELWSELTHEIVGDAVRPRSPASLSAICGAANANCCRGRAAALRRVSKDRA